MTTTKTSQRMSEIRLVPNLPWELVARVHYLYQEERRPLQRIADIVELPLLVVSEVVFHSKDDSTPPWLQKIRRDNGR